MATRKLPGGIMAKNRKYQAKKNTPTEAHVYAAFIADLQAGAIAAVKMRETRPGGKLELEYDEE